MFFEKIKSQNITKSQIKMKRNKFYYIFIKVGIFPIKSMTMTRDLIYKHKTIHIIFTIFCIVQSHCNQTINNISYSQLKDAFPQKRRCMLPCGSC